ncbi:MAG TPA: hypothetical protein VM582_03015 [Candidatus Thermoplasmatota archaeon]|nr:hypothetical protein [Candidatus Thermoplasmatota archaeon]
MRAATVLAILLLAALAPSPAEGTHAVGNDPTCGTGQPVTATHGAGDPRLPTLVYAALKTGFRAVVAWETAEPEAARLSYSLDGGASHVLVESAPRTFHLFVIDGLPIGRTLCFTPLTATGAPAGSMHAFKTRNAMNAHDGTAYTLNLLVLANEQSNLARVEDGMDGYSRRLYDATDGHVRSGRIIIVFGDLQHHNAGYPTCVVFASSVPGCAQFYDALFTFGATPQGAASTFLDGIQMRSGAIWMNWYHQAGLVSTGDNVAAVMMHEVGHYAFGARDVYGGALGCYDAAKGLSVMGSSRGATEFDDEINRCPDESTIAGYAPSYPRLRQRFPLVPDRMGVIDPGPEGNGGIYERHTFRVLPALSGPHPVPALPETQDDAGSGGDAGNHLVSATPVDTGRLYQGTLLVPLDGADVYRFEAPAGSAVEVAVYPRTFACFQLLDAAGETVGGPCAHDGAAVKRSATAPCGTLYLRLLTGTSVAYRFGVGVDAPAPGVSDGAGGSPP